MRTSYGIDDMNQNELFIHNAESIVSAFGDSIAPGKYLVNTFPLLRHVPDWVPGAGFQKTFKKVVEITREAVALPYREAKVGLVSTPTFIVDTGQWYSWLWKAQGIRSIHPSMVASFIEALPDEDAPERQEAEARAMHVCATTYIGK
jgi:hypothetical protein